MLDARLGSLGLVIASLLGGCATCPPCESKLAKAETCSATDTPSSGEPTAAPVAAPSPAPSAPAAALPPAPSSAPPPSDPPAAPAGSLPEVKVSAVGLHIGGGPNDDATKAPYLRAIEKSFDAFRGCFTKVEDPVKAGTFGVDLHIGREGGRALVKQPRTGMKGAGFRDCVLKAFEQVEFEKPKKGPTVISYSIKFTLG